MCVRANSGIVAARCALWGWGGGVHGVRLTTKIRIRGKRAAGGSRPTLGSSRPECPTEFWEGFRHWAPPHSAEHSECPTECLSAATAECPTKCWTVHRHTHRKNSKNRAKNRINLKLYSKLPPNNSKHTDLAGSGRSPCDQE